MLDHFFPLLFPKDSESLKILDIRLQEVGAKRPLNSTSKVNRQTDTPTDRRTFRLIESIGPEDRCFEKRAFCSFCKKKIANFPTITANCYLSITPKLTLMKPQLPLKASTFFITFNGNLDDVNGNLDPVNGNIGLINGNLYPFRKFQFPVIIGQLLFFD